MIDHEETTYLQKMQKVCTFDNISDFWHRWLNLPHSDPRKIFCERNYSHTIVRKIGNDKTIEAIAVFEEGVFPTWEDEVNIHGCDFSLKMGKLKLDVVAQTWHQMVLNTIGESSVMSKAIVGVRVVDKLHGQYKFETWSRLNNDDFKEQNDLIFDDMFNKVFKNVAYKTQFRVFSHSERRDHIMKIDKDKSNPNVSK